jgi:hypothetical protein
MKDPARAKSEKQSRLEWPIYGNSDDRAACFSGNVVNTHITGDECPICRISLD